MKKEIMDKITKYEQEHLLKYYDELPSDRQAALEKQLESIDFSLLDLCKKEDKSLERGSITPISVLTLEDIAKKKEEFTKAGIEAIKARKVGAVLLAGGQGTRLGLDKPKGTFNIGVTRELYIFECLINNLMDVVKVAGEWVPLLIMTSDKNNKDTVEFFEEHNYFGYNKDFVFFFIQEMAPSVDYNGKIYMEDKDRLSMSPNGNGGWFSSLVKSDIYEDVIRLGVEWLNVFAVDNVIQRMADPGFVGATLLSGCASGAKVVVKAEPAEKIGTLCLEDGKPSIVEYYEMTPELMDARDEKGDYAYNYGVILNYLFRVESLEDILNNRMPLHIVEKKIPYMNDNGEFIKPESPNGYKFETLVLDMIHMLEDCLAYEVLRDYEFAPVKNKEGVDSVVSARVLLEKNGVVL